MANNNIHRPKILFTYLSTFREAGGIQKVNKIILKSLEQSVEVWGVYDTKTDKKYFSSKWFRGFNGSKTKYLLQILLNATKWNQVLVGHINLSIAIRVLKLLNKSIKINLVVHGIEVWEKKDGSKKWLLQNADTIISVSQYTKNRILENHPDINSQKIVVLPNCLDPYFKPLIFDQNTFKKPPYLIERYKISKETKVVLTVSRIKSSEKYKGYDLILEALSQIKKETSHKFTYLLCGSYDNLEFNRVNNIVQSLQLQNEVLIAGYIDDKELTDHYLLADIFVMPSKKEGFGLVFIEAAACGTKVIAGNMDGSVEALKNGELGTLISPTDVQEIKNAILKELGNNSQNEYAFKQHLAEKTYSYYNFGNYQQQLNNLLN